ncbi:MAG: murein biosynthesis integral membrane protein MurJ, partial [Candidatus Omnitrophica bacterium]|nr:murein biosynthesis integral membrane protein MurJ [Candidatus Omnitrophota bacterium]
MNVHVSTKIHMARSAGVLGGFTMLSRILGFVRDILIARYFGTSAAAEAFVVSFKLPNLFRDLLGEGAMNSAIVPVLAEVEKKHGQARMKALAGSLICVFIVLLITISIVGVCLAPWMVRLLAPGFTDGSEAYELTVMLTRILFPFVALIGFAALLMGILNAQKIFAPSAAGPALLNI